MTTPELYVGNKLLQVERRIGKGGEGEVFSVRNDSSLAVKIYTSSDRLKREEKIATMVRVQLARQTPGIAFPLSVVTRKDGKFAGFLMRLVSDCKPLHDLYSPGSRKHHFPQADYRFLVRAAANIARAIASAHKAGCVIGDINHSSILISPKATVELIDADSFQFSDGARQFLCRVGVPEYTPPELQGKSLDRTPRTANHDYFGLAVVIFQLLFMGRHPFVGTVRRGDIPPLHESIRDFRYVYAENRDVGMDQPPGTPALSDFSPAIASMFDSAFSRPTADRRPTAGAWATALQLLETSLVQCQDNPLHYGPRDASDCAWCEMERNVPAVLFVPFIPASIVVSGTDPGETAFNIDAIWRSIEAVFIPKREHHKPKLTVDITSSPSLKATSAKSGNVGQRWLGIIVSVAGVIAIFNVPQLTLIWLGGIIWGWVQAMTRSSFNGDPFIQAFINAETTWAREYESWCNRVGFTDLEELQRELVLARDTYNSLKDEERTLIVKYQNERRERQLHSFLDGFDIQHHKVRGIGPAKLAALASYGIDTAADITRSNILAVPGFGEANSHGLLEWRAKLERKFTYNTQPNDSDRREFARIRAIIEAKAIPLRRKLIAGAQNLEAAAKRTILSTSKPDPVLARVHAQRVQAKVDLEFLGIPILTPNTHARVPSTRQPVFTSSSSTSGKSASVSCPRCGSSMVKRLAKRGRNAGSYFWGCSRFPACKGTRNT